MCVALMCMLSSSLARSVNYSYDYSLDAATEGFWINNNVFVARVSSVTQGTSGPLIMLAVVRPIANKLPDVSKPIPAKYFIRLNLASGKSAPAINPGDVFTVVAPTTQNGTSNPFHPFFIQLLENKSAPSAFEEALTKIASIRSGGSQLSSLLETLSSKNDLVLRYGLSHLVAKDTLSSLSEHDLHSLNDQLLKIRDNNHFAISTRIQASQLRYKTDDKSNEFLWLENNLKQSLLVASPEYITINTLLDYSTAYPSERKHLFSTLLALSNSSQANPELKNAIYSSLLSPALFNYSNPTDPLSSQIFHLYISLLNNKNALICVGAIVGLRDLCNHVSDSAARKSLSQQAIAAIRKAMKTEHRLSVLTQMQPTIDDIERFQ